MVGAALIHFTLHTQERLGIQLLWVLFPQDLFAHYLWGMAFGLISNSNRIGDVWLSIPGSTLSICLRYLNEV
jgi:hypothetical protein